MQGHILNRGQNKYNFEISSHHNVLTQRLNYNFSIKIWQICTKIKSNVKGFLCKVLFDPTFFLSEK